jgi:hypothetical protein
MIPDAVIIKEGDEGDSMFFISRSIGYGRSDGRIASHELA